ncbi:MASE1 domain-containing protein [Streptomyces sp. NBC_01221]|uniref:MASE1 domain-containing protein n=1 Tax=unclassified Streptomyces TaxID=2593676 RepID=UPI00225BBE10|nr:MULTISPECIES: MASE1 domain-containing protein [unclassified Streptomyces]WSP53477.1 MASE1 domain-containing protein [Streptomyces sp. NBC_01241]WSU25854.1 MASE1 domain-containing protein [Streptomyces sp. NBC_01108]MCX4784856.1 MASE1 domain-containing protein [Streptomyces sp. NBC_01221]MCX4799191.1 MASE1 domain-containing protein [Streptomyces sp. NBC_01242]WSJ40381.1 MASE1 domain-containing protein [Streptomyces sp. NBC_01321]
MRCVIRSKVSSSERTIATASAVLRVLAVAAAYYLAGGLGLIRGVSVHGAVVTPLWPPTGIALGALLFLGLRAWPGIALGSLSVVATLSDSVSLFTVVVVAGNTLAPVCSYLILRGAGFRGELDRLRDGVVLVFLGALAGMVISATVGTCMLVVDDNLPPSGFWPVWTAWWSGDAMGVLVVTPLLLVLRSVRMPRATDRWIEASALAVASVAVSLVATRTSLAMIYLVFPLIIWAALRFRLAGSAPCAFLVSVTAVVAGTQGVGPFEGHSILHVMVNLAVFNGSVALTALVLAAVVTEQSNIRLRIQRACEELAEVVERLAPGRSPGGRPARPDDEPDGL